MTGRDDELRSAMAALNRGGAVLAGPHGAGRTRLARELTLAAARSGVAVDRLVASGTGSGMPFAALSGLFPRARGTDGSPLTVGEAVAGLAERAEAGRLLLVGDDAHLLDEASAVVIQHVATRGLATVLLTVCTEEHVPEPVTALWKDETLPLIDLAPLSRDAVAPLLEGVLGAPVDGITLERLYKLCEGNLVLLRELVEGAVRDGSLERCGAVWRWRGTVSADSRLGGLVSARLSGLGPDERTVLELLAWGETLGARLLEELAPGADLSAMEQNGLIRVDVHGRRREVRLRRPLYAEVLRARTPRLRADQICRRLAAAVTAKGARRATDRLAIALWHLTAGDGDVDPAVYVAAARSAHATVDPHLAERLARAAVQAAPDSLAAGLLLGETLGWQGRYSEAAQVLSGLDALVHSDADLVQLALARAISACWGRGEPEAAAAVLRQAETRVASAEHRQELQAMRAAVHYSAGQAPDATAAAGEVLEAASSPANLVRMHRTAVPALAMTGRIREAVEEGERCLAAAEAAGEVVPEALAGLPLALASALRAAARLEEAHQLARQVYLDTSHRGIQFTAGAAAQMLGLIALDAGRVVDARRWLDEAVTLLDTADLVGFLSLSWSSLARTLAVTPSSGRRPEQATLAAAAQESAEKAEGPARRSWAPQVQLGRAWVAAADGRLAEAGKLALAAAEVAAALGFHTIALNAAHDALRLGTRGVARPQLEAAAEQVSGPLPEVYLEHATALDNRDGYRLDAVGRSFAALGLRLLAAEAATEAAAAHQRQGSRARSAASGAAAAGYLTTCQGAISPVIAEHGAAAGLTPREREVARLAAAGRSNREIAERLGASVRTVESHLAHAYSKLGITRRDQLTGLHP